METLDIDEPKEITKPRSPWISGLLSFLCPGLGQIYNGQFSKGILYYLFPYFLLVIFGMTHLASNFIGFIVLFLLEVLFRLYSIFDAILWSRKLKEYYLKPYNSWYYHLIIWSVMFGGTLFIEVNSILGIDTFVIPTSNQEPTIMPKDYVVVDMKAYENKDIEQGDIVIYKDAANDYILCRIIGREGDEIQFKNNRLIINGTMCETEFTRLKSELMPVSLYQETLPNGHKHEIQVYQEDYPIPVRNTEEITVPPNNYYVIGDFRDNSLDSRTIGCLTKDKIKGQLKFSYWGASFSRVGIDFTKR